MVANNAHMALKRQENYTKGDLYSTGKNGNLGITIMHQMCQKEKGKSIKEETTNERNASNVKGRWH